VPHARDAKGAKVCSFVTSRTMNTGAKVERLALRGVSGGALRSQRDRFYRGANTGPRSTS